MLEIKYVRKVWSEEQIKWYIENSNQILYKALMLLYDNQTDSEKETGNTSESNGIGFNAYDAPFLCAMARSYLQYGHLTKGQRNLTVPKILKYSKQLTRIANSPKFNKPFAREIEYV